MMYDDKAQQMGGLNATKLSMSNAEEMSGGRTRRSYARSRGPLLRSRAGALSFAIALLFAGCGNNNNNNNNNNNGDAGASADTGSSGGDGPSTTDGTQKPPPDSGPLPSGAATLAGASDSGLEDGFRGAARFNNPVNTLIGPKGNIFVADFDNGEVRKVTPQGAVTTLTQSSNGFGRPFGMAFTSDGTLWVQTDYESTGKELLGALWTVDTKSGATKLKKDKLGRVRGLAALPDGRLAMADFFNHVIELYDPKSNTVTLLAGKKGTKGFADGTGGAARFSKPYDIVVTASKELIISDQDNHRLRKVTLAGVVTTYAGGATAATTDGPLTSARFDKPQGLAMDGQGTIYVTDVGGFVIRQIQSGNVKTIAGAGSAGFFDSTDLLKAKFYGLEGIDVTKDGKTLYVADGNRGTDARYNRIRRVLLK